MADYEVVNTSTVAPEKGIVYWDIDGEAIRECSVRVVGVEVHGLFFLMKDSKGLGLGPLCT